MVSWGGGCFLGYVDGESFMALAKCLLRSFLDLEPTWRMLGTATTTNHD